MLLDFTEPKKVKIDAGFDGGPVGGYVPQMSDDDARRWKAKKVNIGKDDARIELRRSFKHSQVFIIVALDGWNLAAKHEARAKNPDGRWHHTDTRGLNVRMSMNGPILTTFDDFAEINQIIEEAKAYLIEHAKV